MSDSELLSTTAPFAHAPAHPSQPVLPARKAPKKHPAGSRPSDSRTRSTTRHHVHQHRGSDNDGEGDDGGDSADGDVPRDLRPVPAERDIYSVGAFCARHSISRDKFYDLQRQGLAPDAIRIGNRQLITKEAAARWRKALERAERKRKRNKG